MAATELSLLGQLPAELHATLLERLTAQSQDGQAFALSDSVYGRAVAGGPDDNSLRIRAYTTVQGGSKWSMVVLQKPESARLSPNILQRGVIECGIENGCHPATVASALGFGIKLFQVHLRGVRFHQGATTIDVYQLYDSAEADEPLDPTSHAVSVSTRFVSPHRSSAQAGTATSTQDLKAAATAAVHQVSSQLKGIVDLGRLE